MLEFFTRLSAVFTQLFFTPKNAKSEEMTVPRKLYHYGLEEIRVAAPLVSAHFP
jgi:hypothetical protein